jgi:hypothetical protein
MARIKHPYGPWSGRMFDVLRETGAFKAEAFVSWLTERRITIDRTLVSHWMNHRVHLPADILVRLAEFNGRPDWVFSHFLRAVGCELVQLKETPPADGDIVDLMLQAGATLGKLNQVLIQSLAPESPGGRAITRDECTKIRQGLDDFISQLTGLRAHLRQRERS